MNPRRTSRSRPNHRPRRRWAAMVGCVFALLVPGTAAGQVANDSLAQAQADYRFARAAYQAAVAARDAVGARSESLVEDVNRARGISQDAWAAATDRYWSYVPELERASERVRDARDRMEAARRSLLRWLDVQRSVLDAELADATPAERGRIDRLLRDLENQYQELERDRESAIVGPVFTPVELDPRDTPEEKRFKASILERRVREAETQIEEITEEIERLEARLELMRRRADFEAGVGRFDADVVPVGPTGRDRARAGEAAAPDSAVVPLSTLPLPQRVEALRAVRQQLQNQIVVWQQGARDLRAGARVGIR